MKKKYIKPNSLLLQMSAAPMMAALSGGVTDEPYNGVAGAKGTFAFTFEEEMIVDPVKAKEEEDWDDEEEDL